MPILESILELIFMYSIPTKVADQLFLLQNSASWNLSFRHDSKINSRIDLRLFL
jgi:hypothetical protein